MTPENGRGRDGGDRATPDIYCSRHSNPTARIRSLIVGAALVVQCFDAALLAVAVALAGWPR